MSYYFHKKNVIVKMDDSVPNKLAQLQNEFENVQKSTLKLLFAWLVTFV